jgi:hypothetical protein
MRWVPLVFVFGGMLCAQEAPQTGTIHGIVTDEATGLPMRDVPVLVLQRRELQGNLLLIPRSRAVTDAEGKYTIANVPPGTPQVDVRAAKRDVVSHNVTVRAGQDVEMNFSVPPNPEISGRVLDEDRKPVKGASVWLVQSSYNSGMLRRTQVGYHATSAEDGRFLFEENLEAGRKYYLLAKGPTGVPTYYGGSTSFDAAPPVVLARGEQREQVNIVSRQAATRCVDGTVKAGGKPLSTELTVEQSALAGSGIAFAPPVESAADGTFRACGLAAGDYTISGPDNHFHDERPFTIAESDMRGIELNLDPAMIRREFVWDGDPPAEAAEEPAAADSATDESPSPPNIADMTDVQFRKRLGLPIGREVTLSVGRVPFRGKIPYSDTAPVATSAGDLPIMVQLAPGCYVKEITYGGVPVTDGMLHLTAATSATLRIVAAQGGGTISAKVEDGDGHPVGGAGVVIVPEGVETAAQFAGAAHPGIADLGGNFTSGTLAPGKYRVLALTHPYQATEEEIAKLLALLPSAQKVEVGRSGNVRVTLGTIAME